VKLFGTAEEVAEKLVWVGRESRPLTREGVRDDNKRL
jgi:hypothetical protein